MQIGMTKFQIQKEFGIGILLEPSEGNHELSKSEELEYRKLMQLRKEAFDFYFSNAYHDEDRSEFE